MAICKRLPVNDARNSALRTEMTQQGSRHQSSRDRIPARIIQSSVELAANQPCELLILISFSTETLDPEDEIRGPFSKVVAELGEAAL